MSPESPVADVHAGQAVLAAGTALQGARVAVVMLHGRGGSAADILALHTELDTAGVAYLAPQAAGNTWYPNRFMEPVATNEPWLSSALQAVAQTLATVAAGGIAPERTVLLGFSQGACLALEFAARNRCRYGGVVALSGGLIGADTGPRDVPASLAGTPLLLGCSDVDAHIPLQRVQLAAHEMERLGGAVTLRIYSGMGHTVNRDELDWVSALLTALAL